MPSPIESIRKVFGPTWQPAPAFKKLQSKGIYGAVRVKGTPMVYTIGPGGGPISEAEAKKRGYKSAPEYYKSIFGTLEQRGIVGEVTPEQAWLLGIRGPEAKQPLPRGLDQITKKDEAVVTTEGVREDKEEEEIKDQEEAQKDQQTIDKLSRKKQIEQLKQDLREFGIEIPEDDETVAKPALPKFESVAKSLLSKYGINKLQSDINAISKQERELEESFKRGIEKSEARLAPMGVLSSEQREIEKQYRQKAAELRLQKQTLIDEYNTKISLVNTLMEYKALDYQAAVDDYNTSYNRAINLINYLEKKEAAEKSARADLQVILDMMNETNKKWEDLEPEMQAQIKALELKGGLPQGLTQSLYENINPEKEMAFHVVSEDKSQASIIYKDGTVETFSTGIAATGGVGGYWGIAEQVVREMPTATFEELLEEIRKRTNGKLSQTDIKTFLQNRGYKPGIEKEIKLDDDDMRSIVFSTILEEPGKEEELIRELENTGLQVEDKDTGEVTTYQVTTSQINRMLEILREDRTAKDLRENPDKYILEEDGIYKKRWLGEPKKIYSF